MQNGHVAETHTAEQTLSDWLTGNGHVAETGTPEPLPSEAELERGEAATLLVPNFGPRIGLELEHFDPARKHHDFGRPGVQARAVARAGHARSHDLGRRSAMGAAFGSIEAGVRIGPGVALQEALAGRAHSFGGARKLADPLELFGRDAGLPSLA